MAASLRAFLAEIAVDPERLGKFVADPASSLRDADLGEDDVAAIESGDREIVHARLTGGSVPGDGAWSQLSRGRSIPPFGASNTGTTRAGDRSQAGSLVVVGTGINTVGQLTVEAIAHIQAADRVLYVVSCPVAEELVCKLNPEGAESMLDLYEDGKDRSQTYEQMVEHILSAVRAGLATCVAFYGHPGVFVLPGHEAIRRARAEGFTARMLPGISAEDCLIADLGVDPGTAGCQSFEALDFMLTRRIIDPGSPLILWQVGVLDSAYRPNGYDLAALPLLLERLFQYYRPDQPAVVYEGAAHAGCESVIKPVPLFRLPDAALASSSTLFIPPAGPPRLDPVMHHRLGVPLPAWGGAW